ncbi:MAG: helix-turn-helix transcriptional regulator [Hyphomonadaceae bacterium]|nr:helix-turn-helix transcriptional regulator [Hyphomonadaceae bacterium]
MSLIPPRTSRSPVALEDCRLARAIELIGDRWSLLILRSAMYGVRRFDDFQEELGCPRTVLSGRLKALETSGLLTKKAYRESGKRARSEYVLSQMGGDLLPVLIALTQWGDAWLAGGDPAPISFTAGPEKRPAHVAFVDAGGQEVSPAQVRVKLRRG